MKYGKSILILLFLINLATHAQPPEIIYPAEVIYEGYYDDRSWGPIHMGFNFSFYDHPYNHFYVTSNGLIIFGSGSNDYTEDPIPSPSSPNNFIAPFWDDIVINPAGKILYTTIGAEPNRKCIIQWTNMGFYASTVLMGTFQVILYEGSNDIQIQYRSIIDLTSARSHGSSASIGIENPNGTSGVRYSYHNSDGIYSGLAIRFSPSGFTYTMNTSAFYDGIYLTKNINLPEPGIPKLITPANNSIVGTSQEFEWDEATNTQNYTLKISANSDISQSFNYDTGTNTSYDISGLAADATYYWAVFASNTTGTTWSEIYSFTTSQHPPLLAVPQTIWMEQNEERAVRLQYTGGDGNLKTAIITSLPPQGSLYQYAGGVMGDPITSVPATLTDKDLNLIYFADGSTGNGIGNFDFIIQDQAGDSPPATIKVNVNPPGIPNFLLAAKSGHIEMQFDKPMADPTGKEDQFVVKVNGIPVTIESVSLKPGDPYTVQVTLETPLTGGEVVLISYTQGDVAAESGGLLPSFTDQLVSFIIQTVSFPVLPVMTFGDPPVTISATSSSGLPVSFTSSNTTVAIINGNILTSNSTGSADITAFQPGDGTYAPARYIRTLTVNKAEQSISFPPPGIKTYGDPDFDAGASSSSGLPVTLTTNNPLVATVINGNIHIAGAGMAIITASQSGNNLFYPAVDVNMMLSVNKAVQTIEFAALPPATYGDDDIILTASASSLLEVTFISGNTEVAVIAGNQLHILKAGSVMITASQPGDQNYNPAPDVSRNLIVNKADQEITFPEPAPVVYGSPEFDPQAYASSGLPVTYFSDNSLVAEINDSKIYIKGTGNSVIHAYQPGNENFNPADEKSVTLYVTKAPLTIKAENQTKTFHTENPEFTYTCTGFVYGEDISVLDELPSADTEAQADSPAGDYTISVSGGSDDCYELNYEPGILTIEKADQIVTFTAIPGKLLVSKTFELEAVASSGLPVYFGCNDLQTASVSGTTLTGLTEGIAEIRAYQPGDQNYLPAETSGSVEIISTHENILYLFTPNNDGFNDLWVIPGLESYGNCEVKVFNRWGKLVFESKAYHNEWDGTSGGDNLPSGAYYFVLKTETAGTITGTVNLIR